MAYENYTRPVTMIAGQDFSALQYRFISLAVDGQIDPTGYGLESQGVIQNDPSAAGRAASVVSVLGDLTKLEAGGVVRVGREVMSDAVGRGIEATAGGRVQAIAHSASAAAGQIITAQLTKGGNIPQVTTTTTTTSSSTTTTSSSTTTTTSSSTTTTTTTTA